MNTIRGQKKILVLAPTPPPFHGSNYMVRLLLDSAVNEIFDVQHVDVRFSNHIVGLRRLTVKKALLFVKYLVQLVGKSLSFKPDFVVMVPAFARNPFIVSYLYAFVVKVLLRREIILWVHSNNMKELYDKDGFFFKRAIRNIFRYSSLIVPVANGLSESNYSFFSRPEKVKTIHNGIPVDVIKGAKERGRVEITYLSNMDTSKGWKVLFDAAQEICEEIDNVYFSFYGTTTSNSSEGDINRHFASSPYKDRIGYYGPAYGREKSEALSKADIFCLPSFNEAFPLVNLEAMAYGLPIVATNVGGIPETVIEGQGGLLVEKGDIAGLVERLKVLIQNETLRKKMGEFNKLRYAQDFTYQKFADDWIHLLEGRS